MSLRPENRRRRRSEVNIVPLVDVLTTLIFFFLVTMQFRDIQTLNVTLPDIETAGKNVLDASINITITRDNVFAYNGQPMPREQIREILQQTSGLNSKVPVVIRADKETVLDNVTYMMDACRSAGFDDFRLQSE